VHRPSRPLREFQCSLEGGARVHGLAVGNDHARAADAS
jgi:hypothetical protein